MTNRIYTSIKQQFINAGRYKAIMKILHKITKVSGSLPVDAFVDVDGITRWRIDGDKVSNEAKLLIEKIENNATIKDLREEEFDNLRSYTKTQSDMHLHNYTVSLAHRNKPSVKLGKIRAWMILDNLLWCIPNRSEQDGDWNIPKGWQKKNKG